MFHKKLSVEAFDHDCAREHVILNAKDYVVKAINVKHNVPCLAYCFEEKPRRKINLEYTKKFGLEQHKILGELQKGKTITWRGKKITPEKGTILVPGRKVVYVTDTRELKNLVSFAVNADLLICEATFTEEDYELVKEKRGERDHLTAKRAALFASECGAKKLVLTHFSQRYKTSKPVLKEAKKYFENTVAAEDFMKIKK